MTQQVKVQSLMTCTYQQDPCCEPGEPVPESYPLTPHGCLGLQKSAGDGRQPDTQTHGRQTDRQTPRHTGIQTYGRQTNT